MLDMFEFIWKILGATVILSSTNFVFNLLVLKIFLLILGVEMTVIHVLCMAVPTFFTWFALTVKTVVDRGSI